MRLPLLRRILMFVDQAASSAAGLGMDEGGSLVGNESASVLSRAFSRASSFSASDLGLTSVLLGTIGLFFCSPLMKASCQNGRMQNPVVVIPPNPGEKAKPESDEKGCSLIIIIK